MLALQTWTGETESFIRQTESDSYSRPFHLPYIAFAWNPVNWKGRGNSMNSMGFVGVKLTCCQYWSITLVQLYRHIGPDIRCAVGRSESGECYVIVLLSIIRQRLNWRIIRHHLSFPSSAGFTSSYIDQHIPAAAAAAAMVILMLHYIGTRRRSLCVSIGKSNDTIYYLALMKSHEKSPNPIASYLPRYICIVFITLYIQFSRCFLSLPWMTLSIQILNWFFLCE